MLPIQLPLLFRDTGDQGDLRVSLNKVLAGLIDLVTTLQKRLHEILVRYPRLYSLLTVFWSMVVRVFRSVAIVFRLFTTIPRSPPLELNQSTADTPTNRVELEDAKKTTKDSCVMVGDKAHCCVPESSSLSFGTSETSVGEDIDGGVVSCRATQSLKRCSYPGKRGCELIAIAGSQYCQLHHVEPCSSKEQQQQQCGGHLRDGIDLNHNQDFAEECDQKKYFSRDCNCGPMLCVADFGGKCDTADPEWRERIVRLSREYNDIPRCQLDSHKVDTTALSATSCQAVATRVTNMVADASRKGVADFVLVEYQCKGAGVTYAIAEMLADSNDISPDTRITFVLVTSWSDKLPSRGACGAIESLGHSTRVECVVVDLKDLSFHGLLHEFVEEWRKPYTVVYSTHLCGADADLAIRSLSRSQGCTEERCASLVATSCCHHQCEWTHFVGRAPWIRRFGLSHSDFVGCVEASRWGGDKSSEEAAVGRVAARLIDAARFASVEESDDFSLWTSAKTFELCCSTDTDDNFLLEFTIGSIGD
ncbi:hypothetical protein Pmar_PMAR000785 [Perkinsus marinus ATCC 50983]|uniref:tRNA:m(4)X modification enzyme TRM13 n=1 Tax=Perkinsus marinus (strain ATCC 50983 / TXsc) TaxID=423536 RepID=C5KXL6_PERM5|nr:hypothetical protein Pmar_PMAR000785 [Perkinsus marinus ATCC 50983]EER10740.1 hypothetical protein Pmar_PMAR000785 [Perkinsus marinus ATCC 50983]|eukprot:XP_002778945.1 hypothetical protein Pmar_PMAR000785 [Perkinsus marinus ATCC 50983]